MTEYEGRDLAALDTYVRSQLAKAAEAYTPHANMDARLAAVLKAAEQEDEDLTVPGKLGAGGRWTPSGVEMPLEVQRSHDGQSR